MGLTTPVRSPSRRKGSKPVSLNDPITTSERDDSHVDGKTADDVKNHPSLDRTAFEPIFSETLDGLCELRDLICFGPGPTRSAVTFTSTATIRIGLLMPTAWAFFEPTVPDAGNSKPGLSEAEVATHTLRTLRGLSKPTVTFWAVHLEGAAMYLYMLVIVHNNSEREGLYGIARPRAFKIMQAGHASVMSLRANARVLAKENSVDPKPLSFHPLLDWMREVDRAGRPWLIDAPATTHDLYPRSSVQKSPLESMMSAHVLEGPPGGKHCSISALFDLALVDLPRPAVESVGRLRSLRLYRSKKKPFNHEYVVAGFGPDGQAPTSWVRLERAARTKNVPNAPQADSVMPALSGVAARETVTFASSLEGLCSNSDEFASLELHPFSVSLLIRPFIAQIIPTSVSNLFYQLFTANCRWFARRIFLNVLLYSTKTQAPHNLLWKGKAASSAEVEHELAAEPFGGSTLRDKKGNAVDVEAIMNMEMMADDSCIPSPSALDSYLEASDASDIDPDEKDALRAYLLMTRGKSVSPTDFSRGVADAHEAIRLIRLLPSRIVPRDFLLATALRALANIFWMHDMTESAIPPLREAIAIEKDPASAALAATHAELGYVLAMLPTPNLEGAAEEYEKAWDIMRRTPLVLQLQHEFNIPYQITHHRMHAYVLGALGRVADRVQAAEEAVALAREVHSDFPERSCLFACLASLAVAARKAGSRDKSLERAKEAAALGQREGYQEGSGDLIWVFVSSALEAWEQAGFSSAIEILEIAIVVARAAEFELIAPLQLASLRVLVHQHMRSNTLLEVSKQVTTLMELERNRLSLRPTSYSLKTAYATSLIAQGKCLAHSGQPGEAIQVYGEATQILATRGSGDQELDGEERDLTESLVDMFIAERLEADGYEADIAKETVNACRIIFVRDPSNHEVRDALRQALLRYSQIVPGVEPHESTASAELDALRLTEPFEVAPTLAAQVAEILRYGDFLECLGHAGEGLDARSQAVALARTSPPQDAFLLRCSLTHLADAALRTGDYRGSLGIAKEAAAMGYREDSPAPKEELTSLVRVLFGCSSKAVQAEDIPGAIEALEEAIPVIEEAGLSLPGFALARPYLAKLRLFRQLERRDKDSAREIVEDMKELIWSEDDDVEMRRIFRQRAPIIESSVIFANQLTNGEKPREAIRILGEARQILEATEEPWRSASRHSPEDAVADEADIKKKTVDVAGALVNAYRVLCYGKSTSSEPMQREGLRNALRKLADALEEAGRHEEALLAEAEAAGLVEATNLNLEDVHEASDTPGANTSRTSRMPRFSPFRSRTPRPYGADEL